jgi:hypothetical protein
MSAVEHLFDPGPAARTPSGPKGARVGDVVIAEGSRWQVQGLDPDRREAICRLLGGSHALRRFRARRIEQVLRRRDRMTEERRPR